MIKYVFDLDNTLVYTDSLNNESYNFALMQLSKQPIINHKRITRNTVFSVYNLTECDKRKLIEIKQQYFIQNISKTVKNTKLTNFLDRQNINDCVLWTSSEKIRCEALLKHYCLENKFCKIFYSKKQNLLEDIEKICTYFGCNKNDLKFFENNKEILNNVLQILH